MTTRISWRPGFRPWRACASSLPPRFPTFALLLLAGCSPDLSLLSDQTSFGGVGPAGEAGSSVSGANGSASNAGGSTIQLGGEAGQPTSGGDTSMPPADGGAAGAPGPGSCVPSGLEICNGKDDDCNGIVDEGCPGGVTTTFQRDLQLLGDSQGGTAFTDDCKNGEVLGGVDVTMGAFLSQIRGICRTLSLELSSNAVHGYKVKLSADRALSAHPTMSQDTQTHLSCPEDDVLVGVRISQQNYIASNSQSFAVIPRIWLTCAQLVLAERDGALGVTWQGAKELAPASGSIANGTAWFVQASAPDGLVASRLLGASGSWVDRVGFGVSRLDVLIR
jgi:hypothetical protein